MDVTGQESPIVSDLTDLDRVRLADLHVMTGEAVSSMLCQIVRATPWSGRSCGGLQLNCLNQVQARSAVNGSLVPFPPAGPEGTQPL